MTDPFSFRTTVLMLSGLACLGCAGSRVEQKESTPPSVVDTLTYIEVDLSRMNVINPSDLLSKLATAAPDDDPPIRQAAVAKLEETIQNLQCYDMDASDPPKPDKSLRRRNPLVAVITGPMQLQVQGQFAYGGTLTVAAGPSVAGTATRQTQEQAMFPLTMVSLANLPAFYLGQQTANIQYVTLYGTSSPPAEIQNFLRNSMKVATKLRDITNKAFENFDRDEDKYCSNKDNAAKTTIIPGAGVPGP